MTYSFSCQTVLSFKIKRKMSIYVSKTSLTEEFCLRKTLVCGKPDHRMSFSTSPCGERTNIEEIILNLNMCGKEERKRTILASFRKRAEILYPLK